MDSYDVIVVGARVAGAATALLLARRGLHVLLVDRDRYGTDTLSTHALMRSGVLLLSRWGLLNRIVDAGTPPIGATRFHYGDEDVTVTIKPAHGVHALYAPRRTLLDRMLVDEAVAAGVNVHFGLTVTGLLRDRTGRVVGIRGRDRTARIVMAKARLTVGADGVRSTVARHAGAATVRTGAGASTIIYGYWSDLPADGYEWFYRPGYSAGIIPTNAGQACVFAGTAAERLTGRIGADLRTTYHRLLAAAGAGRPGGAGARLAAAVRPHRLHTWIGRPGFIRQAHGPGWALAGDAGSFLDPLSTHGITDALRDADALSRAITDAAPNGDLRAALDRFAGTRNQVVEPLFQVADRIARYRWDDTSIRSHLRELSAAMSAEADLVAAGSTPHPHVAIGGGSVPPHRNVLPEGWTGQV